MATLLPRLSTACDHVRVCARALPLFARQVHYAKSGYEVIAKLIWDQAGGSTGQL